MNKKRRMKRINGRNGMTEVDREALQSAKVDPEEYAKYVKEHNKRLRQLEREARGQNMEYPDQ